MSFIIAEVVSEREVVILASTWPGSIKGIDVIALCRPKGVLGASWGTSGGRQGSCSGLGFLGILRASISGVVALAPAKLSDLIGQEYFGAKITQAYVEVMCSKAK